MGQHDRGLLGPNLDQLLHRLRRGARHLAPDLHLTARSTSSTTTAVNYWFSYSIYELDGSPCPLGVELLGGGSQEVA